MKRVEILPGAFDPRRKVCVIDIKTGERHLLPDGLDCEDLDRMGMAKWWDDDEKLRIYFDRKGTIWGRGYDDGDYVAVNYAGG